MKILLFVFLFIISSMISLAQAPVKDTSFFIKPKSDTTIYFRLEKGKKVQLTVKTIKATPASQWYKKISLRQSFQNKNDKAEPAFANLVYPKDSASSQNFGFAIGYNVFNDTKLATLNPFIEWQKNNVSDKKQNAFLAGVNYQTAFWDVLDKPRIWTPYIIVAANYKHDAEKKTEGAQASLYFTPVFNGHGGKFYPLPDAVMTSNLLEVFYNVYAGTEFENRSQVKDPTYKGKTWRWYSRVTATFYPLPKLLDRRLEIIPDYTYRNAFSNSSAVEERINELWKLSCNVVLFSKEKSKFADVKLGYSYTKGCDPTSGFDKQRINTLSLKIKI